MAQVRYLASRYSSACALGAPILVRLRGQHARPANGSPSVRLRDHFPARYQHMAACGWRAEHANGAGRATRRCAGVRRSGHRWSLLALAGSPSTRHLRTVHRHAPVPVCPSSHLSRPSTTLSIPFSDFHHHQNPSLLPKTRATSLSLVQYPSSASHSAFLNSPRPSMPEIPSPALHASPFLSPALNNGVDNSSRLHTASPIAFRDPP